MLEWNARTILTLWGPPDGVLDDYANRQWSGLVSDYYAKRWALFAEALDKSLAEEKPFGRNRFRQANSQFGRRNGRRGTKSYPTEASGEDPVALSKAMYEKYEDEMVFEPEMRSLTTGETGLLFGCEIEQFPGESWRTMGRWATRSRSGPATWGAGRGMRGGSATWRSRRRWDAWSLSGTTVTRGITGSW